jgi:galactokinase
MRSLGAFPLSGEQNAFDGFEASAHRNARLSFVAPARVNLIGEHTDYTGGLVLPMAIGFYTEAALDDQPEQAFEFSSELFPETRQLPVTETPSPAGNWSDYSLGVLQQLQRQHIDVPPFKLRLKGNIPLGSGLSSSASVEVASAYAMLARAGVSLAAAEVAQLCRRAENEFVGSPCGIMDQFVITAAQADHALLLHTDTLEIEHIPMRRGGMADVAIVVVNSMVRHSIANGAYADRRRETEFGQTVLARAKPAMTQLGKADLLTLEACKKAMPEVSFKRCRHIISENERVRKSAAALQKGDARQLGTLMLESHRSQRDDFECSCPEVDFLVEAAMLQPGCLGSRITGGGFGGCTVNLVERGSVESFLDAVVARYTDTYGIVPESYVCEAVDGAERSNRKAMHEMAQELPA